MGEWVGEGWEEKQSGSPEVGEGGKKARPETLSPHSCQQDPRPRGE